MKVIYKQPIDVQIHQARIDADRAGKKIDYIELTVAEGFELAEFAERTLWWPGTQPKPGWELRQWLDLRFLGQKIEPQPVVTMYGINIRIN